MLSFKEYLFENKLPTNDVKEAYKKAKKMGKRYPEGEEAIATSAEYSYHYATDVIRGPWPLGEEAIATSAFYSYMYAFNVIKGLWPDGEAAIAKDAEYSYKYAKNVIKGPWPPGEKAIFISDWLNEYINDVLLEFPLTNADVKRICTNQNFINRKNAYEKFVNNYFKDNSILRDMWLKYGENHR